jgi:integrase
MPRYAERHRFTETKVDAWTKTPPSKETLYWDSDVKGLGVRVRATGGASYVFRYSLHGKAERITLGGIPGLTLADARAQARDWAAGASAAKTNASLAPRALHRAEKAKAKRVATARTFGDLVKAYLADRAPVLAPATHAEYTRMLTGKALAGLRARRANEVTRTDVREVVNAIAKHGTGASKHPAPKMARRVWVMIGACYRWAITEEWGEIAKDPTYSPKTGGKKARSEQEQPRKQSLTVEQYAAVGDALRRSLTDGLPVAPTLSTKKRGGLSKARKAKLTGKKRGPYKKAEAPRLTKANPVQVASLRFLALTGWRRGEVYSLRWRDLRENDATAVLPETKTGLSVRPLGKAALDLLAERKKAVEGTPDAEPDALVFPMPGRSTKRPEPRHLWYAVRHAAGTTARLHDLRHSFITMCRRFGYHDGLTASVVGHAGAGMTAKYGDVADERVRAAVEDVSEAIALAMRGHTARVLELTKPKRRLRIA